MKAEVVAMLVFDENGLKFNYPEHLKLSGGFSWLRQSLTLVDKKTKGELSISLWTDPEDFETLYESHYDPTAPQIRNEGLMRVIRAGDYPAWAGSKEIYSEHRIINSDKLDYYWRILIPCGSKTLEIIVSCASDREINELWRPIIESLKLDPAKFPGDPTTSMLNILKSKTIKKKADWIKSGFLKKPKHFKYVFSPDYGVISIYDATVNYEPEENFDDNFMSQRLLVKDGRVDLAVSDALSVIIDFNLNPEAPENTEQWEHVAEGSIMLESGRLLVHASGLPEVEITFKSGAYRFQVYFGQVNVEKDSQHCLLYFWETTKPVTDRVKIIKQGV